MVSKRLVNSKRIHLPFTGQGPLEFYYSDAT